MFDGFRLKVVGKRLDAVHPTTAWQDEELARVQRELELKFPGRTVEILDWSETRGRVLFRVTGGGDSGRVFVYQRPEDLVLEILRRAPWLNAATLGATQFFEFAAPDGARLSGYVTSPRQPRRSPTPVVLVFPTGFPGRAQRAFDPEAHLFADLGYTVIRLNHRSVAGVRKEDLNSLRSAVDRVAVEDARTVLERVAALHPDRPIDGKRVVAFGREFGGYLAVRALQLQPHNFRGGIAINGPMELRPWLRSPVAVSAVKGANPQPAVPTALLDYPGANWGKLSVLENVKTVTSPVLLLVEPTKSPAIDSAHVELRSRLQRLGRADLVQLAEQVVAANHERRGGGLVQRAGQVAQSAEQPADLLAHLAHGRRGGQRVEAGQHRRAIKTQRVGGLGGGLIRPYRLFGQVGGHRWVPQSLVQRKNTVC